MTFMPWTDALCTGIASIDRQHRWLVDITNRLHDELDRPTPRREILGEILEGLVDYTMNHFLVEEELFQRLGYPETPEHKAEHDLFAAQAMDLLLEFENGGGVGAPVLEFLREWLSHHILKVDRAYVPFLRAAGIE